MSYLIGSGYVRSKYHPIPSDKMAELWLANIRRYANPAPSRIVVVTAKGDVPPIPVMVIPCHGDLGHLLYRAEPHAFAGWTPPVIITAFIAYNEVCDFIFLEQDAFVFGPWVERLYKDIGDAGMVMGRGIAGMGMPATQSLFLVRHKFIPWFVRDYLNEGPDDNQYNKGEYKFDRIRKKNPGLIKTMSFGPERDRPIPWGDEVFYAQQMTAEEHAEARSRKLIIA